MTTPQPAAADLASPAADSRIECVTQHPSEPVGPDYLAVCTKVADLIATSIYCPEVQDGGECGGHPICWSCYALGKARGLVR